MSQDTFSAASPLNVIVAPGSPAEASARTQVGVPPRASEFPAVIAPGISPSPDHDLVFNGGKTIADLIFTNLYVGGTQAWQAADIQQIDRALSAAMSDVRLNNVMSQYYPGGSISSTFLPSQILPGTPPTVMSQADVEALITRLYTQGTLPSVDLSHTVFNLLLPPGAVLNSDSTLTQPAPGGEADPPFGDIALTQTAASGDTGDTIGGGDNVDGFNPEGVSIAADSLNGLGGYHGSVHLSNAGGGQDTVYYAAGVYSQILPDGSSNGIIAFDTPWKNVAATFYHELNEARTDPDVEDAIHSGDRTRTGWISAQGEECGDFPVFEASQLSLIFQEVPLADGSGTVPIQFQYSNAVHGPEGPIDTPHTPAR